MARPYSLSTALRHELATLRFLHVIAYSAILRWSEAVPRTRHYARVKDHVDQMYLEGLNEHLNRIVDATVFGAYYRNAGRRLSVRDLRAPRSQMLSSLAKLHRFEVDALPGWQAVQAVLADANATKHRVGLEFEDSNSGHVVMVRPVSLYSLDLRQRIREVSRWLRAFIRAMPSQRRMPT